jgi:citrate lyase gamma subunit
MRANFLRSAAFLVFMTVILVGWGSSLGSRPAAGTIPMGQVDNLPFAEFKGIGPGTFTLTNPANSFLVKTGRRVEEVSGPSYTAIAGQYVWEISGGIGQFTFFLTGTVDLEATVEEGCRISYLHLDDESDQRINRFTINGEVVHTINPEQVPDPAGLVIYSEFIAPTSGALAMQIEDSGGVVFKLVCSTIDVVKTANPEQVNASGEPVQFTVSIENTGLTAVTINSLVDDQFGDLNGQGTCSVPQTIPTGGSYSCTFTAPVNFEEASCTHINVVTASGQDGDGEPVSDEDDATVIRTPCASIDVTKTPDPAQVEAPGGDVVFTVQVANTGPAPVTINSLTDDVYGDLNGQGNCSVPQTIAVGGTYSCSFTGTVSIEGNGNTCVHVNTITATGVGENEESVQDSDDAEVEIVPCAEISVSKTPDPAELPLPGGEVVFTVVVANTGSTTVTIDSLVDDVFGDLNGQGSCSVPQEIAVDGTYECAFTGDVELSEELCTHVNTITASGPDVEDQATAEVTCLDRKIEVTKTANPAILPIPGGDVQYTVVVANTGTAELTIDSLVDDKFGDLNGRGSCSVPQTIPVEGSYSCTFTGPVTFSETVCSHTNTVVASGVGVSGQDSATVTCSQPELPEIRVVKSANPAFLPKPGGEVAYTVTVFNEGERDVLIDSLTDDKFGNLNGQGDCSVPQTIAVGGSYACTFTATVTLDEETCTHINTVTAGGPDVSESGSATVSCEIKDRKPACLRINFEVGPDQARRGTFVVRETGGKVLATWWAEEGWMDSGWIEDIDISAPAVYVQVIFVKGDGTEIEMKILNPAPDTSFGWLARGQCHAIEVAWP